jgi:hypothetical protein
MATEPDPCRAYKEGEGGHWNAVAVPIAVMATVFPRQTVFITGMSVKVGNGLILRFTNLTGLRQDPFPATIE